MRTVTVALIGCVSLLVLLSHPAEAGEAAEDPKPAVGPATPLTVACGSKPGERQHCPADTSGGVAIVRSHGESACLLGKTWGYDDKGIWVSDGCSADFVVGKQLQEVAESAPTQGKSPEYIPNARLPPLRGREGPDLRAALQLRPLPEPEGPRRDLRRRVREHADREAARGRAAQQVLPALLRLVPDPEVPLLPLRLVVEPLAGRSRAGGGRRQPQLQLQPLRDARRRHHQPAERAQHRGPVPVLARRRRPPDRRRVLPRLLHHGVLAQGRAEHQGQVHGDARQQPEHARRQRVAARQHARHHVLHAAVAAHDRRVRPLRHLRRLRLPREGRDAPRRALHAQHRGQAEPAGHQRHREQPDPSHGRQHHLHARPVRRRHHGREGHLRHVERRRRHQVQGPVTRSRVLLALAEQLQGREHSRHRRHRRPRLPGPVLGDGGAEGAAGLSQRLGDRRPLRRRVRGAGGPELVRRQGARVCA